MELTKDLLDELMQLATKHHAQDILNDMPVMNEVDLHGALNYLRRLESENPSEGI